MRCNRLALLLSGFVISPAVFAEWEVNLVRGVTEISHAIFDLHMIIFYVCVAIAVVVFGVMLWAIVYHRKSRGAKAQHFHEHIWVEILWTIVPFGILVAMAVPATQTLIKMYDKSEADINIQVTGYQWKWRYQYLGQDIDFFSNLSTPQDQINNEAVKGENYLLEVDRPVVIPVGKKVRFLITANDVIHSWWVPALAVKQDAIPGFINEAWTIVDEPGIYRGQCAELCGRDHGFMPVVVDARSEADYQLWLASQTQAQEAAQAAAEQTWTMEALISKGEEVYKTSCLACHQANGQGIPGAFPGLVNTPLMASDGLMEHARIVVHGRTGTAMQAFGEQLSDVDLAAVITYERNAWGNDGGMITPQQIKQLKEE
ncbi:cytochrome c oxidase subunit II [Aliamphritea hakodatensis]|uniref:cytochrome c oxidase subunit II n=1 Tax=Aliamphritea hakodatensis TaxID=2895352 RepID=UPI0022FDB08D|nr:cytochrome c oxidase subunit II [Aliamphritea hakodatensis]